jgi:AcrR family transcriptional regulator
MPPNPPRRKPHPAALASLRSPAGEGDRPPLTAYRLPRGHHGLSPAYVAENQRWRLVAAAGELFAERPYAEIRTADLADRAGVSRSTLYRHFDSVADCFLAAYDNAAAWLLAGLAGPCSPGPERPQRLGDALLEALDLLADEPDLARLLGPALPAALPAVAARRDRLLDHLAARLHAARPRPAPVPERRLLEGALALLAEPPATAPRALPAELADLLAGPSRRPPEAPGGASQTRVFTH